MEEHRRRCEAHDALGCHEVRIVAERQQTDLGGLVGRMVASMLLGIAQMKKENLRERRGHNRS